MTRMIRIGVGVYLRVYVYIYIHTLRNTVLSTQCLNIAVWEHCCLFWALGLKVGYFEFGVLPVSGSWLLAIWLMRSTKKLHDSPILGLHGSYYELCGWRRICQPQGDAIVITPLRTGTPTRMIWW